MLRYPFPAGLIAPNEQTFPYDATAVVLGNSLEENGFSVVAPNFSNYYISRTPFHFINQFIGSPFRILKNAGVTGTTSANWLARLARDVLAYKPGVCFVGWPLNDALNATTIPYELTIANLTSIFKQLFGIGCIPITITGGAALPINTGIEKEHRDRVNSFLRAFSAQYGFFCGEGYASIANQLTGAPATGTTYDASHHPNAVGCMLQARSFIDYARSLKFSRMSRPDSPTVTSLHGNPCVVGDNADTVNGFAQQSGITGTGPSAWTSYKSGSPATVTTAKVARTDGIQGEWAAITGTATTDLDRIGFTRTITLNTARPASTAVTLGDRIRVNGEHYVVTTAGTTSAAPGPTFNTAIGEPTTDGTAVYTRVETLNIGDTVEGFAEVMLTAVSLGLLGSMPTLLVNFNSSTGITGLRVNSLTSPDLAPPWPILDAPQMLRTNVDAIPAGTVSLGIFIYDALTNLTQATFNLGLLDIHKVAYAS